MRTPEDMLDKAMLNFAVAFVTVLAITAGAILTAWWSFERAEAARDSARRAVDVVSDQHALAQEISGLLAAGDEARIGRLREAATTFARQHQALLAGDDAIGLPPRHEVLTGIWYDAPIRLDDHASHLVRAAEQVAATGAPLTGDALLAARTAARAGVADGLAAAAGAISSASVAASDRAGRTGRAALAVALAAALIGGAFVFRPLARRARTAEEASLDLARALRRLSTHDALTDLPNRAAFHARLGKAAAGTEAFGVHHLQIADLAALNRIHGESRTDQVLTLIARALERAAQPGDFVARTGPGDFRLIQTSGAAPDEAQARCRMLVRALSASMELSGGARLSPPMIGAVALGRPGVEPDALTRQVEIALAAARRDGAGAARLYAPELGRAFEARNQMEADLKAAFELDQFEPFFQPQICARSGAFMGFEALARWRHPRRGLLAPRDFLYVASDLGYGDALDERIMEKSMDELTRWRKAGLDAPGVSINFASDQLSDPYMIEKIRWAVERRDLEPSDICIEILETVLMEEEGAQTIENIEALARAGFRLDLDDFGTGHASIAALRRFAVERIKIDSSFVRDVDTRDDQKSVITAMIELAHSLDVRVVAEGVETEAELRALQALDCDVLQGFLISRPLPSPEAEQWARAYTPAALGRAV